MTEIDSDRKIILVVEDDRSHRLLIGEILVKMGFSVIPAESGSVALEKLGNSANKINLILLDYEMPDMDGAETVREIRAKEQAESWPRIPVIAFTANRGDEIRDNCLAAGMDDYLSKEVWIPKWRSSLEETIRKWI